MFAEYCLDVRHRLSPLEHYCRRQLSHRRRPPALPELALGQSRNAHVSVEAKAIRKEERRRIRLAILRTTTLYVRVHYPTNCKVPKSPMEDSWASRKRTSDTVEVK